MPRKNVEAEVEAIEALKQRTLDAPALETLRSALRNRNNFVVSKAANIVAHHAATDLTADLLVALDRFYIDAAKSDPQCWAKNAIAKALLRLEYDEAAVYERGLKHIQNEPVWGAQSDTAATLRAVCAQGLVECRSLAEVPLLRMLVELFKDKDKTVQTAGAQAIAQVNSSSAALLLRLRALLGSGEAEVLGACYAGVLEIEGAEAMEFVAGFMSVPDEAGAEAALAIGRLRTVAAFERLQARWKTERDPWFGEVLLSAMALTRQPEAVAFLVGLIEGDSRHAEPAIGVLAAGGFPESVKEQVEAAVRAAGNPRLVRCWEKEFSR